MSVNLLENINMMWNPTSGEYIQPPESIFGKLYCRKIQVYPSSRNLMKHVIGKGGKNFYHFTTKYNLVYIFYHENNIEVWGENKQNVHDCIHEIIDHMKNVRKQQYEFKMSFLKKKMEQ